MNDNEYRKFTAEANVDNVLIELSVRFDAEVVGRDVGADLGLYKFSPVTHLSGQLSHALSDLLPQAIAKVSECLLNTSRVSREKYEEDEIKLSETITQVKANEN